MSKPKIMIVSCFHMAGHKDLYGTDVGDILCDKRQKEILEVVESLKNFGATKVAVEREKKNAEALNENFKRYLNDDFELGASETHQIAFRVARELNHNEIYAVDWMEEGARTRGAGEIFEYAKNHQPELFQEIDALVKDSVGDMDDAASKSIGEILREANEPTQVRKSSELYLNLARIGVEADYYGMGWLIWWYQRNLIIFANLAEMAEANDKIMLLIGGSHTGIVSGFLKESRLFEVVCATEYL